MIKPTAPDYASTPFSRMGTGPHYRPASINAKQGVAIVTPFFNTDEVFLETAACVSNQTFQNWEWVIVDDCSTDEGAQNMLTSVAAGDSRIKVIRLPQNGGPSKARNIGIQAAQAGYIFQLDSDDLVEPTAIEKLLWFLECNPKLAFAKGYEVGFGAEGYLWNKGFHLGAEFLEENLVQTNSLVRKSVFIQVGGYDESIRGGFEDWDFWLRCASAGLWGNTVPEYLHWYRRRPSHADRWANFASQERKREFHRSLRARHSELSVETFPSAPLRTHEPYEPLQETPLLANPLAKAGPRLLFVVPHYEMGGADKFNVDLLRQLVTRKNFEVTMVSTLSPAASWVEMFTRLTSDVFILPNLVPLSGYPAFFEYLIRSRNFDAVLISNSAITYQLTPFLRETFPQLPILDYIHMEEEYWKSGGYGRYSLNYDQYLEHTLVSSQHLKSWLMSRGKSANTIEVVYTGIDPEKWHRASSQTTPADLPPGLRDDCTTVLFAGRLCDQKQPELFLQVARRLLRERPDIQFVAAGDGEYRHLFEQQQAGQPDGRFLYLGAINQDAIHSLLSHCNIFFLPSKMEGISLAIYESMSMGVVPVGANVGGQAELVTPETGVLIERSGSEYEQYSTALRGLVDDPARLRRMAQQARQRILDHFSLNAMGDAIAKALTSASHAAHSRPNDAAKISGRLLAAEVIEQQRLEALAQRLWNDLSRHSTVTVKTDSELTVFIDLGRGYSELDARKYPIHAGQDMDIWLPLKAPITGGRLRIDPVSDIGTITIHAIYLRHSPENLAFWSANTCADLAAQIEVAGTARVLPNADHFILLSYGDDPIIYLPYVLPGNPDEHVMFHLQMRFERKIPVEALRCIDKA